MVKKRNNALRGTINNLFTCNSGEKPPLRQHLLCERAATPGAGGANE